MRDPGVDTSFGMAGMASQKCAKQLLSHLSQAQAQNMHMQGWTRTQS